MTRADRRRWMRVQRRRLAALILPRVAPRLLRVLSGSWKIETLGNEHWDAASARPGMLATLWHGRMILPIPVQAGRGICVLVSPSGDGELVLPILERFGYQWVLGSSNKNPARAVRELLDRLRSGGCIVITPDGPRGPMHSIGPGVAFLSRVTGRPVLPVGFACDRSWHLHTWDRYTIPKPRAHVVACYRPPVLVPKEATTTEAATSEGVPSSQAAR